MTSPSPDSAQKRICLGKIAAAHGIKGLVKILPFCEDVSLLSGTLYTDERRDETLKVKLLNPLGKYILAEIEGITSRNDAETLKCSLFVPRETLPETNEGEYYIEDLVGLSVVENGVPIGTVTAAPDFGAGVLLDIELSSGQSFYIPFQGDHVGDVDLEAGTVQVMNTDALRMD